MKIIEAIKNLCRPVAVETPREARIFYWQATSRDWRWHMRAANNEIMAQGEGYTSKQGVLKGIATVKAAIAIADVMER